MRKIVAAAMIVTFLFAIFSSASLEKEDKRIVRIALYDSISPSVNLLEHCLRYAWEENGIKYEMDVKRIGYRDVINGSLQNYDVLVIGASGRQYFHALNKKWKDNVKQFVANGGGYVGICGGANIATKGYEKPRCLLDFVLTKAALGFIDAYINDDQWQEWQYLWKEDGRSNIPIKNEILSNEIFAGEKQRYITYGGGPGLYGMKEAIPLAIYREEPSDVATLHYWIWLGKWIPYKKIETDIKDYYSAAEAMYGKGKVVIFGMHPEIPPRFNGSVYEYFGLSIYGIPRYVYGWIGGERANWSYNWWIVRRSIAYVCSLPLPPAEELYVYLQPLQGKIVEATVENAERVDFYIDGSFYESIDEPPFRIKLDMNGKHIVKAIAYRNNAEAWHERIVELP
ncbi:MAG: hypothetical protein DRN29_03950 [Thermoplasmata archaeon]|nr:MAG: hypothetical protein DRN29_03950 [Thermoplasmata archaeon]